VVIPNGSHYSLLLQLLILKEVAYIIMSLQLNALIYSIFYCIWYYNNISIVLLINWWIKEAKMNGWRIIY